MCVTRGASLVLALQATNTGIESVISQLFYKQAQHISIAHVFNVVIYTAITNEFSDNFLLMPIKNFVFDPACFMKTERA